MPCRRQARRLPVAHKAGGCERIEEHDARIRRVTAREMQELANRYFVERELVQSVVRGTGRRV